MTYKYLLCQKKYLVLLRRWCSYTFLSYYDISIFFTTLKILLTSDLIEFVELVDDKFSS